MDNTKKVSIILPTYNGSKFIRKSIDSCLNQTYKNIELIVVDDGSTDNTIEIVNSYDDDRILLIKHETNKNLPNSLNTGFKHATGNYLTWTSDDNYYATDAIENMLVFLQDRKCEFVYCDYYRFNEDDTSNLYLVKTPDALDLNDCNYVGACFLYTQKVKDSIGDYDPEVRLAEDYDYWVRISKKFRMCHLPKPYYFYRSHENSLSNQFFKQYDIQLTALLVKLKNELISITEAKNLVYDMSIEIARNKKTSYNILTNVELNLYKYYIHTKYSKKLSHLMERYVKKTANVSLTRSELKNIIFNER